MPTPAVRSVGCHARRGMGNSVDGRGKREEERIVGTVLSLISSSRAAGGVSRNHGCTDKSNRSCEFFSLIFEMERMQLFINLSRIASVYFLKYQYNDMIFLISYFITFVIIGY